MMKSSQAIRSRYQSVMKRPQSDVQRFMRGIQNSLEDYRYNLIVIIMCSLVVTIFFLCTAQYYFAGGAGSFFIYANSIVSGTHTLDITQRDIGFPLMLVLSGFPWTHSILNITILHAVMGFLIPVMVFAAVGNKYPRAAFIAAILCILSLVPYQFIKMMYHDQTYLFFNTLCVLVYIYYCRTKQVGYLYALTFAALFCSFTRPAGNASFLVLMICAYFSNPMHLRHYIICLMIFSAFTFANYEHRRTIMGLNPGEMMPSYTGHQIFYNVYVNSADSGIKLSPEMGPAMKRISDEIRKAFGPNPALNPRNLYYKNLNPEFYNSALNINDTEEFIKQLYAHPYPEYFELIHTMASVWKDSPLFLQASWEVIRQNPFYPVKYTTRNLLYYFFKPGKTHLRLKNVSTMNKGSNPDYYPRVGYIALENGLAERAKHEMEYNPLRGYFSFLKPTSATIYSIFRNSYNKINIVTVILMIISLSFSVSNILKRNNNTSAIEHKDIIFPEIGTFALLFYNALITSMFVDPIYRYHYMSMPLQMICAGFGIVIVRRWWMSRKALKCE